MMRLVSPASTLHIMRRRIRARLTRSETSESSESARNEYLEIDPGELTNVFAVPNWLRDLGLTAWLLVGVGLLLAGLVWLLWLTETIVMPVIAASVTAAVATPLVAKLNRHGVPRPLSAILVLLATVALGIGLFLMIVSGITSETASIEGELADATDTLAGWLEDAGVDSSTAEDAKVDASTSVSDSVSQLLEGIGQGISALSGIAFFLALTALSLFFLLSDGPKIRAWIESHMGVPPDIGHAIGERTLGALRGYFLGVTIVAAFNAVVITAAALIIGVPLAGTIAVVTFLGAYIPYVGAWAAATFVVLLTLGSSGADDAAIMIVVQLLANGALQQMVQPFAMGAALGIHPLAALVVTIAGGALFGTVGLILAAPLTSAVTRISEDLARAQASQPSAGAAGSLP